MKLITFTDKVLVLFSEYFASSANPNLAENHSMAGEGTSHAHPADAALFPITCILIGVATDCLICQRLKTQVPYTALLVVWGLCIGLLQAAQPATNAFSATLSIWMDIDPHLLLLVFLPVIGFAPALEQEPHLLRKNWAQILILAWPCVIVSVLLIGVCAYFFFPYGWSWAQCLLLGAVLSATDPVAILAGLHELGADEKLSSLIEAESAVNDGSAFSIFLVLNGVVGGQLLSAGEITVSFVHGVALGSALGLAFGLATSLWLALSWLRPGLEIVLTLGAAYGCHFVTEDLLGASGLLAVVVMGFSMSILGRRTSRNKTEVESFWHALVWLADTILFIWVGIMLAFVLLKPSDQSVRIMGDEFIIQNQLKGIDAAYGLLLYAWLLVSRGVALCLFYPLLSSGLVGYPMTWKTALFMTWSGSRGRVGVAMALFIALDPMITDQRYKAHAVFFMAAMAFSTTLFNGMTATWVLRALGLVTMTPQQLEVLEYVLKEVEGVADCTLDKTEPDGVLGAPDPALVKRWSEVGAADSLVSVHNKKLKRRQAMAADGAAAVGDSGSSSCGPSMSEHQREKQLREYRVRLSNVVKGTYGDMYQHFDISTSSFRLLQEVTDKATDASTSSSQPYLARLHQRNHKAHQQHKHQQQQERTSSSSNSSKDENAVRDTEAGLVAAEGGLTDWRGLERHLQSWTWNGHFSRLAGRFGYHRLQELLSQRETASKLQLVSAFVTAHSTAQQVIGKHLAESHGSAHAPADNHHHQQQPKQQQQQHLGGGGGAGGGGAGAQLAPTVGIVNCDDGLQSGQQAVAGSSSAFRVGDKEAEEVAQQVLRESRTEADSAWQYAHEVLLPLHPGLGRLLMSRKVAIKVLQHRTDFLTHIHEAGLVRAEEVHKIHTEAASRLEHLQHERHAVTWPIIKLEDREEAQDPSHTDPTQEGNNASSSSKNNSRSSSDGGNTRQLSARELAQHPAGTSGVLGRAVQVPRGSNGQSGMLG